MAEDRSDNEVLYLVDGSSYLYRAYHALPQLTNSSGEPTGALLGVANMLRRLLNEAESRRILVVFDAPGKTFRHEQYPEYKAHRPPMPDPLRQQIEPIHELVELLGLPMLQVPGVEADDVIGTLAVAADQAGLKCVISTGDKDLAQLVTNRISLVNTMTDTHLDQSGVEEKFGVSPERFIDFLALTGDKSDNIPGVEKCGPKTAQKWLTQYGSLDEVMAHADDIGGKIGEHLRAAIPTLPLSRQLVTIRTDLELDIDVTGVQIADCRTEALEAFLKRYEFNSWLKEIHAQTTPADAVPEHYRIITSMQEFQDCVAQLRKADLIAFDTETTSIDPMRAKLVGLSFCSEAGHAAYVPLEHDYPGAPEQLSVDEVLASLKPLLEDPGCAKVGQHIKYDMNVLSHYDIRLRGIAFDTMLESYVFNSTGTRHDMDSLALKYLGRQTTHYEEIAGKGAKQIPFSQVPVEDAGHYAAEDADVTLQLHRHLWPRLQEEPRLAGVLQDIEIPLVPVLAKMEQRGVLVDADSLRAQSQEMAVQMHELETRSHELAGQPFNLGSPKQLQQILFEHQGLPVVRKTPKGQPSTAEDVLQELSADYELPRLILEHRSLSKLKSTYTDRLPEDIHPKTGRIHTSYHQAVAATGRLSSSSPNLQNIPIRTDLGRRIRRAFIAPEGMQLLACDYSQIELRIMAHISGDQGLLDAFRQGVDIHRATASEVFDTPYEQVSGNQRRAAKAINFGLMYGMSAFGLARQLELERGEAQAYMDAYFARYPNVLRFMEETRHSAQDAGYVETLFGRRLYLPEIRASQVQRRQAAERAALHAPMQGTAADIIKRAMISVDKWLREEQTGTHLVMQVHDELVLEVPVERIEEVRSGVIERMSAAADLDVPLTVEAGHGNDWDSAH